MQKVEGKYLKQLFDQYFEAPIELWEQFSHRMIRREFKKNEIIKNTDEKEKFIDLII